MEDVWNKLLGLYEFARQVVFPQFPVSTSLRGSVKATDVLRNVFFIVKVTEMQLSMSTVQSKSGKCTTMHCTSHYARMECWKLSNLHLHGSTIMIKKAVTLALDWTPNGELLGDLCHISSSLNLVEVETRLGCMNSPLRPEVQMVWVWEWWDLLVQRRPLNSSAVLA